MIKNPKKFPALIALAILTLTYLCNIYLNARLYNSSDNQADEILYRHVIFEPIFWILPVIFLLIRQKKAQTRIFSTAALILVGIVPLLRLISFLTVGIFFDHVSSEWLAMFLLMPLELTAHPLVYMLIQTIFITLLWMNLFFRDED